MKRNTDERIPGEGGQALVWQGHRRRGYATELAYNELCEVALKRDACFVFGAMLDWQLGNKGHMNSRSPTLDRLDNESVIRRDNILILCYKCNATKRDGTSRELLDYCEAVVRRFHSHFEYPQLVHL
jgi:hypothetical protein